MTKQEKLEEIKNQISEKFGNKTLSLVLMISDERFGEKSKLKMNFYQSILDGYIKPSELWTTDDNIQTLKSRVANAKDSEKESVLLEIIDTYDTKDPKVRDLLNKHKHLLSTLRPSKESTTRFLNQKAIPGRTEKVTITI